MKIRLQGKEKLKEIWSKKSEGFGDTVAKITKSFGIEPCEGCERRRRAFNRAVSYQKWKNRFLRIKGLFIKQEIK